MAHPRTSRRRASALSSALFFIGLAIIALTHFWWPLILLVIGIPLALRQFLLGHTYDTFITLAVFISAFITAMFSITWDVILFVIFGLAALFILMREFQEGREHPEDLDEEDLNHEIEEMEAENAKKSRKSRKRN